VGVAIGDQILDLTAAQAKRCLHRRRRPPPRPAAPPHSMPIWPWAPAPGLHCAWPCHERLREGYALQSALSTCLVAQADAEFAVPAQIGDYTDFYTSVHHATNIGKLLRPDNPLLPNYKWIPIGYHGRSSSHRHLRPGAAPPGQPGHAPRRHRARAGRQRAVGLRAGNGHLHWPRQYAGRAHPMQQAEQHVFGMCLFNDWSARDVQGWEYQPLGPFLAKNFASTVSPWVVTMEALAPYRQAWTRTEGDPQPLPYLDSPQLREQGAVDIELEVFIQTAAMREQGVAEHRLSHSNFRDAYWSVSQMVAHHTVNGCNLQPGDLLGSGTQSGPAPDEAGSLMELSKGGKEAITLPNGEKRTFLEDGDTIIFRGRCQAEGAARIGFGEVRGTLLPARALA
jgi:fumarylacetoacetase